MWQGERMGERGENRPAECIGERVRLRRTRRDDLAWMAQMACDPELVGEHNWAGEPRDAGALERQLRTQFEANELVSDEVGSLVVELDEGTPIGEVSWRTERWGPSERSRCRAFGIALLPPFRGKGYGTEAQQLLIDFLFARDPDLHRVQTDTAADNPAEQRSLTKAGMIEEGLVRNAEFRDGTFHDHVLFSILRAEWEARVRR